MTTQEIIAGLSDVTEESDFSAIEKAIREARANLRVKKAKEAKNQDWKTEGSDIDANLGSGNPIRRG